MRGAALWAACCLAALPAAAVNLPNVTLTTHENRTVRFYDDLVRGKMVVISFMFTTCEGICPRVAANIARVRKTPGASGVHFYSITLDPTHDTPAVLAKYAAHLGAGPDWTFLTGAPEAVETLRRGLGLVDPDPAVDADKTQHGGLIAIGNDPGPRCPRSAGRKPCCARFARCWEGRKRTQAGPCAGALSARGQLAHQER